MSRAPTGTFNENEEAERKMGENLSEINRGPLLKKQRWRRVGGSIIEIPHRGLLFSSPFLPENFFIQQLFNAALTREEARLCTGAPPPLFFSLLTFGTNRVI